MTDMQMMSITEEEICLASDMLWWASTMFVYNARPQDPQVVGESWRDNWLDRLEKHSAICRRMGETSTQG